MIPTSMARKDWQATQSRYPNVVVGSDVDLVDATDLSERFYRR